MKWRVKNVVDDGYISINDVYYISALPCQAYGGNILKTATSPIKTTNAALVGWHIRSSKYSFLYKAHLKIALFILRWCPNIQKRLPISNGTSNKYEFWEKQNGRWRCNLKQKTFVEHSEAIKQN